jgi:subtilisin-like proprotein convertase family protein
VCPVVLREDKQDKDMPKVHLGRKDEASIVLEPDPELIAVRTRSGRSLARSTSGVPSPLEAELADGRLVVAYPEAQVEVYRVPVGRGKRSLDERKRALRGSPDVRFAGGVLVDPGTREPVLYTENLFVKFVDEADPEDCRAVLREAGLEVKQTLHYATNAFFVQAAEGTGQEVFVLAQRLLARDDVEYCHPELIRQRARKAIHPAQWHLKRTTIGSALVDAHANVEAAHVVTRGAGVVVAIIDDGVDIDHVEFSGSGKVVAPRDATRQTSDPRPLSSSDNHGTACAGVAVGNGSLGASGVAPEARLMPIRLMSGLGSQREADAFVWAADHGADVISCSWGPEDGAWWDPSDPLHGQGFGLPASTRLALEYVTNQGRGGKGCVVCFAAGNGNESVDLDGYASFGRVIAVAACNDRGKRSVYSDKGRALWCSFPSSDFGHPPFGHPDPITTGIWTVDRSSGAGYNPGSSASGDPAGMFTNDFGGTSSACPGVAGVAALILSVDPARKWHEVRELLKQACERIDPSGGAYDASGHSRLYGYGRVNALKAVELAKPQPRSEIVVSRRFDGVLPDLQTVEFALHVAEDDVLESAEVHVDLRHTYIGDLVLTLLPPPASGVGPIVLHDRKGGSKNDLRVSYDVASTPALAALSGRSPRGTWTLRARDAAAYDMGTLVTFGLTLRFAHPDRVLVPAPRLKRKVKRSARVVRR